MKLSIVFLTSLILFKYSISQIDIKSECTKLFNEADSIVKTANEQKRNYQFAIKKLTSVLNCGDAVLKKKANDLIEKIFVEINTAKQNEYAARLQSDSARDSLIREKKRSDLLLLETKAQLAEVQMEKNSSNDPNIALSYSLQALKYAPEKTSILNSRSALLNHSAFYQLFISDGKLKDNVIAAGLSSNEHLFAALDKSGRLYIWDVTQKKIQMDQQIFDSADKQFQGTSLMMCKKIEFSDDNRIVYLINHAEGRSDLVQVDLHSKKRTILYSFKNTSYNTKEGNFLITDLIFKDTNSILLGLCTGKILFFDPLNKNVTKTQTIVQATINSLGLIKSSGEIICATEKGLFSFDIKDSTLLNISQDSINYNNVSVSDPTKTFIITSPSNIIIYDLILKTKKIIPHGLKVVDCSSIDVNGNIVVSGTEGDGWRFEVGKVSLFTNEDKKEYKKYDLPVQNRYRKLCFLINSSFAMIVTGDHTTSTGTNDNMDGEIRFWYYKGCLTNIMNNVHKESVERLFYSDVYEKYISCQNGLYGFNTVAFFDKTGKFISISDLAVGDDPIRTFAFDEIGTNLYYGTEGGKIGHIPLDLLKNEQITEIKKNILFSDTATIDNLRIVNSKYLSFKSGRFQKILNLKTGAIKKFVCDHAEGIPFIKSLFKDKQLIGYKDGYIYIYDIESEKLSKIKPPGTKVKEIFQLSQPNVFLLIEPEYLSICKIESNKITVIKKSKFENPHGIYDKYKEDLTCFSYSPTYNMIISMKETGELFFYNFNGKRLYTLSTGSRMPFLHSPTIDKKGHYFATMNIESKTYFWMFPDFLYKNTFDFKVK